jgi:hypothetical protein
MLFYQGMLIEREICLQDTPHLWFGLENIVRLVFVYKTL